MYCFIDVCVGGATPPSVHAQNTLCVSIACVAFSFAQACWLHLEGLLLILSRTNVRASSSSLRRSALLPACARSFFLCSCRVFPHPVRAPFVGGRTFLSVFPRATSHPTLVLGGCVA